MKILILSFFDNFGGTENFIEKLIDEIGVKNIVIVSLTNFDKRFKKNKKTLFLFESVGCYLEENIVNNILSTIKSISAKGSIVIQDLYSTRFLHQDEFQRVKRGKKLIQNFGENWNFTINMGNNVESEISKLLEKNNLIPLENYICGKNSTKSKNPFYAISLSKV